MKKGLIKALVLCGVFLGAVMIFEVLFNASSEDMTSVLGEPTLPVIYLSEGGLEVNELFGYTADMEETRMRDTITPLEEDWTLPISIRTYENKISSLHYEVRSFEDNRLIEDHDVTGLKEDKGKISANLKFQNILDEKQEYLLVISLIKGSKEIHYYSRILYLKENHTKECVSFALDFHDNTIHKDKDAIASYLETDYDQENTDLHQVNIHSSADQVCWGDFKGKIQEKPIASIKEVNESYQVINLSYVMNGKGPNGELEYYNVEENYRIRYSESRMYLLGYQRTMNQIFRGENTPVRENSLMLGIREEAVDVKSNGNGTDFCFVQEGELWSYSETTGSLARVFSFRGYEGMDTRENNSEHQIKIIKVDETGSADFIVYGYMSRGKHEGRVGIAVCHFDSVAKTVEEQLWIPFRQSYQVIKEEVGRILYISDSNILYLMLGGRLYQVDLSTGNQKMIAEGNGESWIAASEDNSRIAWCSNGDENAATSIKVFDTEKKTTYEIKGKKGTYLRPLGFLNTDFVYGIASSKKVTTDAAGNTLFPMSKVVILDKHNKTLKEYRKKGIYISSVEMEDYTIYLNRAKQHNGAYVKIRQDSIVNMAGEKEYPVTLTSVTDSKLQNQWELTLNHETDNGSLKVYTPKLVLVDKPKEMKTDQKSRAEVYYAYSYGKVDMASTNVADVIVCASKHMGVVIDSQGGYIWERARKTYQSTLSGMQVEGAGTGGNSIEKCLTVMLKKEGVHVSVKELLETGKTPKEILTATLPESTVLDLTGCTLEELIYYVSNETPVYALVSGQKAVLIAGYDSSRVVLYDPGDNTTESMSQVEAQKIFTQAGNVFLAYLRKGK